MIDKNKKIDLNELEQVTGGKIFNYTNLEKRIEAVSQPDGKANKAFGGRDLQAPNNKAIANVIVK